MNGHAQWSTRPFSVRIDVSGKVIRLKLGDCFMHKGCIVKVDGFAGNEAEVRGIYYLPWRGGRWATPKHNMFGDNARFIKLPPARKSYSSGEQVDLAALCVVADPSKLGK